MVDRATGVKHKGFIFCIKLGRGDPFRTRDQICGCSSPRGRNSSAGKRWGLAKALSWLGAAGLGMAGPSEYPRCAEKEGRPSGQGWRAGVSSGWLLQELKASAHVQGARGGGSAEACRGCLRPPPGLAQPTEAGLPGKEGTCKVLGQAGGQVWGQRQPRRLWWPQQLWGPRLGGLTLCGGGGLLSREGAGSWALAGWGSSLAVAGGTEAPGPLGSTAAQPSGAPKWPTWCPARAPRGWGRG